MWRHRQVMVKAFLERQIEGGAIPVIDATYMKVRRSRRVVLVALIIVAGVNANGQRELLGIKVTASETEPIWTEFLRKLNGRGLRGVKLVVSDTNYGIKAAVTKVLSATWQRCRLGLLKKCFFALQFRAPGRWRSTCRTTRHAAASL
ncbi:hypothetical protein AJ88_37655 [Mesorhizobium amorphae CCBAU 01583]|nr:hypothetical protein AJ88_37655 [Mesorhizobium amorphae CCBAU 01583]